VLFVDVNVDDQVKVKVKVNVSRWPAPGSQAGTSRWA
jgi:hypothetical protein